MAKKAIEEGMIFGEDGSILEVKPWGDQKPRRFKHGRRRRR